MNNEYKKDNKNQINKIAIEMNAIFSFKEEKDSIKKIGGIKLESQATSK